MAKTTKIKARKNSVGDVLVLDRGKWRKVVMADEGRNMHKTLKNEVTAALKGMAIQGFTSGYSSNGKDGETLQCSVHFHGGEGKMFSATSEGKFTKENIKSFAKDVALGVKEKLEGMKGGDKDALKTYVQEREEEISKFRAEQQAMVDVVIEEEKKKLKNKLMKEAQSKADEIIKAEVEEHIKSLVSQQKPAAIRKATEEIIKINEHSSERKFDLEHS